MGKRYQLTALALSCLVMDGMLVNGIPMVPASRSEHNHDVRQLPNPAGLTSNPLLGAVQQSVPLAQALPTGAFVNSAGQIVDAMGNVIGLLPLGAVGSIASNLPLGAVGSVASNLPLGTVGSVASNLPLGAVGSVASNLPLGNVLGLGGGVLGGAFGPLPLGGLTHAASGVQQTAGGFTGPSSLLNGIVEGPSLPAGGPDSLSSVGQAPGLVSGALAQGSPFSTTHTAPEAFNQVPNYPPGSASVVYEYINGQLVPVLRSSLPYNSPPMPGTPMGMGAPNDGAGAGFNGLMGTGQQAEGSLPIPIQEYGGKVFAGVNGASPIQNVAPAPLASALDSKTESPLTNSVQASTTLQIPSASTTLLATSPTGTSKLSAVTSALASVLPVSADKLWAEGHGEEDALFGENLIAETESSQAPAHSTTPATAVPIATASVSTATLDASSATQNATTSSSSDTFTETPHLIAARVNRFFRAGAQRL